MNTMMITLGQVLMPKIKLRLFLKLRINNLTHSLLKSLVFAQLLQDQVHLSNRHMLIIQAQVLMTTNKSGIILDNWRKPNSNMKGRNMLNYLSSLRLELPRFQLKKYHPLVTQAEVMTL